MAWREAIRVRISCRMQSLDVINSLFLDCKGNGFFLIGQMFN